MDDEDFAFAIHEEQTDQQTEQPINQSLPNTISHEEEEQANPSPIHNEPLTAMYH